jgi:UDP-N-acetylglucosamine/UDP-N-acetylgalactosamine diphosphorylase
MRALSKKVREGAEIELSPLVTYTGEGLGLINSETFMCSGIASAVEGLDVIEKSVPVKPLFVC